MYNVKVKKYKRGEVQTRVYSNGVEEGKRDSERYHTDFKPLSSLEEIEPFTKQRVQLCNDFDELEAFEKSKKERSLRVSCNRAKQKIYDLSRANDWEYFVTLTLSPEKVDRYSYSECSTKISQWLKDFKKRCNADFKYIIVPELHKDGAYHFHGLFSCCNGLEITPSGHFDDKGRVIYNIGKYSLGWTTATAVEDNSAVTKYITKYTTKELMKATKGRKKYWHSNNCCLPEEETMLLDTFEKFSLESYLEDNAQYFKRVIYDAGCQKRAVFYYETIEKED